MLGRLHLLQQQTLKKFMKTAQFTLTELKVKFIKLHKKIRETTQQECSLQYTQEMRLLEENVKLLKTHNEDLKKELSDLKKELTAQRERYEEQLAHKDKEHALETETLKQHIEQLHQTLTQTYQNSETSWQHAQSCQSLENKRERMAEIQYICQTADEFVKSRMGLSVQITKT
ncbi:hypothetical protein Pelo_17336 [Pelomyxa schiedti]|nr:hypothetical protein Pelo_17336 [Pelomyxa schiedti]